MEALQVREMRKARILKCLDYSGGTVWGDLSWNEQIVCKRQTAREIEQIVGDRSPLENGIARGGFGERVRNPPIATSRCAWDTRRVREKEVIARNHLITASRQQRKTVRS